MWEVFGFGVDYLQSSLRPASGRQGGRGLQQRAVGGGMEMPRFMVIRDSSIWWLWA
jgi:hypothetical protein